MDRTGNCLFNTLKKSLSVCTASLQEATYFPNHYFRRMVVHYMVNHWQLIYINKYEALMSLYGVVEEREDPTRGWNPPLSFKQYLCLLLQRDFLGDEVVLFTVSCMWSTKITILNMKMLQECRIQHNQPLDKADVIFMYNVCNHFNAAGM